MNRSIGKRRGRNQYFADDYFLYKYGISPMAAFFLALPVKQNQVDNCGELLIKTDLVDLVIRAGISTDVDGKRIQTAIPWGMQARRIMLYVFSQSYQSECAGKPLHNIQFSKGVQSDFLRSLGYQSKTSFSSKHSALDQLRNLANCEFDVARIDKPNFLGLMKDNKEKCDFTDMHVFTAMTSSQNSFELKRNVKFPFALDLPVDYNQAIRLKGKNLAWNIYVFLADILPRIPKGKRLDIPWEKISLWFCNNYPELRKFRHNFRMELENVLDIYRSAKGRVDTDSSEFLRLRYTAPPVEHRIHTNSRFSYRNSPDYKEPEPEYYNEKDQSYLLL